MQNTKKDSPIQSTIADPFMKRSKSTQEQLVVIKKKRDPLVEQEKMKVNMRYLEKKIKISKELLAKGKVIDNDAAHENNTRLENPIDAVSAQPEKKN